jgi:cytochrome c oxidase subunit 2
MTFLGMPGLPPDLSTHGYELDQLTWWVHILMAVLFVGWGAFFLYTLVRFRRGRNPKASYEGVKSHLSSYVEVGIAVIEAVLLFALAIPLWGDRVNVDFLFGNSEANEVTEDVYEVRVVAQQFAWNVHYPGPDGKLGKTKVKRINETNPVGLVKKKDDASVEDDIVTINVLAIPVNRPVLVHLSSLDVIHSFSLPVMRVKHDAVPGMHVPLWFEALKTSKQAQQEIYEEKLAAGDLAAVAHQTAYDAKVSAGEANLENPAYEFVGDFEVACAQLCGAQHFKMKGTFLVLSDEDLAAWMKTQSEY